jgi:hypothetical protein
MIVPPNDTESNDDDEFYYDCALKTELFSVLAKLIEADTSNATH